MPNTQLQLRRGTTAEHAVFTGAQGELTFNTTTKKIHLHDGSTVSGLPLPTLADLPAGLPTGATEGQVLTFKSGVAAWATPTAINSVAITDISTSAYTLKLGDQYVRSNYAGSSCTIIVQTDSVINHPIGTQITVIWAGGNQTYFQFQSGVTVVSADGLNLRKVGSAATLTKVAANKWDLVGDMRIS